MQETDVGYIHGPETYGRKSLGNRSKIPFRNQNYMQHHTAGPRIGEVEEHTENEEMPSGEHLGILWHGNFKPKSTAKDSTLWKIRRRYADEHEAKGGNHHGQMVPGIKKWNQMRVRERGDGGYVVVQVDPKVERKLKSQWREKLAIKTKWKWAERMHMKWLDNLHSYPIAYHVVVFPSGRAYAGRCDTKDGEITNMVYGAHAYGYNDHPSISWPGDYRIQYDRLTKPQIATTCAILRKYASGYLGHRERPPKGYPTSCPGVMTVQLDIIAEHAGVKRTGYRR